MRYERGVAGGHRRGPHASGTYYLVYTNPYGVKFRSKKEVGRSLGLRECEQRAGGILRTKESSETASCR